MKKKKVPNKLTDEENKSIYSIIESHMNNMVEELNNVNSKNSFTGFEQIGQLVLFGAATALQDGYNVTIKLDIIPEEEDGKKMLFFDGIPINLN